MSAMHVLVEQADPPTPVSHTPSSLHCYHPHTQPLRLATQVEGGVHASGTDNTNMSRDFAIDVCKRANLTDFYYDSCVFDLMSTGDSTFR